MKVSRLIQNLVFAVVGFTIFLFLWWAITYFFVKDLPQPQEVLKTLFDLLKNPFYDNGPNDKGIGWQLYYSLKRVILGFLIGSLIGIPVGFILGVFGRLNAMFNSLIQILRPVSPLAWFPIGLALFQNSEKASIFTIAITSIWPTLINTAYGASTIPQDFKNVSKVFGFSILNYFRYVVVPYTFSFTLTGLKISIGIAWMVIVASEMLAGGTGIGFYIWDSWNALNLRNVMSAIILIGVIGYILDYSFSYLQRRFQR